MTLRAHVGGVVFHAAPPTEQLDEFEGFGIVRGGLVGWWGRPGSRGESSERPMDHGEFDLPTKLGGRTVTISGFVAAPYFELDAACERLSGLGADGERLRLVVDKDGLSTWSWVRVIGAQVDRETLSARPRFLVTLRAADMRRYGDVRADAPRTSTPIAMLNRGNFPAAPRFTARGPQPGGYSIVAPGRPNFQVDSVVPAGSIDVVDFATGVILRNGTPLVGAVVNPRVWSVPAGGEQRWYASPTGAAGSVTGEVTDTYV